MPERLSIVLEDLRHAGPARGRRARSEHGLTLIEVAIGLLVLAAVMLGAVSLTLSAVSLSVDNREMAAANDVLRRLLEELQNVPFDEAFARFNGNADDDPDGPDTARGGTFTIEPHRKEGFLSVLDPGDPATSPAYRSRPLNVQISFPVDAQGRLSEAALGGAWSSRAWDLDGDSDVTSDDCSSTYRVLPVRVRISWNGGRGVRSIEHVRLMARRRIPEVVQ